MKVCKRSNKELFSDSKQKACGSPSNDTSLNFTAPVKLSTVQLVSLALGEFFSPSHGCGGGRPKKRSFPTYMKFEASEEWCNLSGGFACNMFLYMMVRPYCISVQMGKNKRRPTLRSIFDWTCSVVWPTGKCLSFVRYQSLFPPFQTLARVKADVQQDGRLYVSWTSGREDPLNCSSLVNI